MISRSRWSYFRNLNIDRFIKIFIFIDLIIVIYLSPHTAKQPIDTHSPGGPQALSHPLYHLPWLCNRATGDRNIP
jgi:hypothetical protein